MGTRSQGQVAKSSTEPTTKFGVPKHYQPHDKFAKYAFKNPEIALDFFNAHLTHKGLGKQELSEFKLFDPEFHIAFRAKQTSDVVYHGSIDWQYYYIDLEHQSKYDATMPVRMYLYSAALIGQHLEPKNSTMPSVVSLCVYHDPANNRPYPKDNLPFGAPTTLDSCFISKKGVDCSSVKSDFTLVDLTVMKDEVIAEHGNAAMVEWILRDAYLPGDKFLPLVKKYLKSDCYKKMKTGFSRFKEAIYEYVSYVCEGDRDVDSILDELREWIPEEEGFMKTAGERLQQEFMQKADLKIQESKKEWLQEGMQKGMQERDLQIFQMIQHLMQIGVTLEKIKASSPELVDEVLARASPVESEASSPLQTFQATSSGDRIMYDMSSMREPEASGSMNLATASNSELGSLSQVNKAARTQ